jgi:hypothetical protein
VRRKNNTATTAITHNDIVRTRRSAAACTAGVAARPVPSCTAQGRSGARPSPACRCRAFRGGAPQRGTLGPRGPPCGVAARGRRPFPGCLSRLPRQLCPGCGTVRLTLQRTTCGAGSCRRCPRLPASASFAERSLRRSTRACRRGPFAGRWKIDASLPRLRQADGNRLLRRACTVLAFANVLDLLANELTGLCGWRPARAFVVTSSPQCRLAWHVVAFTQVLRRPFTVILVSPRVSPAH